jgi:ribosomal protein S18 acetylase RimI-like enzyme
MHGNKDQQLHVLPTKFEDLQALANLHLHTIGYLSSVAPEGFGIGIKTTTANEEVLEYFQEALDNPDCIFLTAQSGSEIAGYVLASIEEHGDDLLAAPFVTVEFVEVFPKFRRQGIARALMAEMETLAKRRGVVNLDLLVWDANASAKSLFQSLGYIELEHRLAKIL